MPRRRILIVDDNPVNLKLVRVTLDREGYELTTATCAEEALAIVVNRRPSLILLDIELPGMNGLELARRIKSDPDTVGIGIVAVTAFATVVDEQNAYDAGCDGFIRKPIDTRKFGAQVHAYLAPATGLNATLEPCVPKHEGGPGDDTSDVHGARNG